MIWDILYSIRDWWKEFTCKHEYEERIVKCIPYYHYWECVKCGRVKRQSLNKK